LFLCDPAGRRECHGESGRTRLLKPHPGLSVSVSEGREKLIMAIISTIDHQRGVVELDSELGMLQAHAPPVELKGLHVGDKLLVQVAEGEPPHPRSTPTS
jgi:hypothetical protein